MKRVVVTGLGMISPVGIDKKESWHSLIEGVNGIRPIQRFDTSNCNIKYGGEIKNLGDRSLLDILLLSAREAIHDSGFLYNTNYDAHRVGVAIGTLGGDIVPFETKYAENRQDRHEIYTEQLINNFSLGKISTVINEQFGFAGSSTTFINACASGNHAIAHGYELIRQNEMDQMVVGGVDTYNRMLVTHFDKLRSHAPDLCRPFDKDRKGLVVGEGAGVLVIEDYEIAKNRNAYIYAELGGYGISCDGHHMTQPDPKGHGAIEALKKATSHASVNKEEVDYISSHGTGTFWNDKIETLALKTFFGAKSKKIPMSSIKSMIGHSMGGASAIESVVSCMIIQNGIIPPTINLSTPDPECDLDYVPNVAREQSVNCVLNISFGFGGNNAVTLFKRA